MSYKITPLRLSVHLKNENPFFGDCLTHVSIEDEGAGPFIVLEQHSENIQPGTVMVDIEELDKILVAARFLISKYNIAVGSGEESSNNVEHN